jgi:hypothetical protein
MPATGLYVNPLEKTLQGAEAEWREYGIGYCYYRFIQLGIDRVIIIDNLIRDW